MREVNSAASAVKVGIKTINVLIVDDDTDIRSYIHHILKKDYSISSVDNGYAAIERIKTQIPDLIITDLDMPGKDGLTLVKEIRSDLATRFTPIIMLSATTDKKARKEAINAGVNAFFKKPFNTIELQRVIKNSLLLVQVRKQTREMLLDKKRPEPNHTLVEAEENLGQYMQLIESLPAAFYYCDASGKLELYNRASITLWGKEPSISDRSWCGLVKAYKTNGEPYSLEECPLALTFKEGKIIPGDEFVIERPDGSRSNVVPYPEAIFDDAGNIIGGINMLVDITGLN